MISYRHLARAALILFLVSATASAQERAYFVTYDHYLEEKGNLEIAVATTTGLPKRGQPSYIAPWLELEYGLTGWWTAELYLEGVSPRGDSSGFTGWRWENRLRPLSGEHRVNPVLYVEYENINETSRIQKEIVGSGPISFEPMADLRRNHAHEVEGKLILSSVAGPWNVSENVIVEKNLSEDEGFEFGYSVGVSRSLGELASGTSCRLCAENFVAGFEVYGGLGTSEAFAARGARHYLAPIVGWHLTDRSTLKISPAIGLTDASDRYLVRVGWSYELPHRRRR